MSESNHDHESTAVNRNELAGKYLTFRLGNEEYGLIIHKVREIIGLMEVTEVPRTPEFIRGVINLRGTIIPVISLRVKFDMKVIDDTDQTCIIVLEVPWNDRVIQMGMLVDEVSEVLDIDDEHLEDTPIFGSGVDTQFILGVGKVNDKVVMLLDADRVLSNKEMALVSQASGDA